MIHINSNYVVQIVNRYRGLPDLDDETCKYLASSSNFVLSKGPTKAGGKSSSTDKIEPEKRAAAINETSAGAASGVAADAAVGAEAKDEKRTDACDNTSKDIRDIEIVDIDAFATQREVRDSCCSKPDINYHHLFFF